MIFKYWDETLAMQLEEAHEEGSSQKVDIKPTRDNQF